MELFSEIAATPLPTLLVVAGLFFLMLSVVRKFGALVVVTPGRERVATIVGLALLALGIGLQMFIPGHEPRPPRSGGEALRATAPAVSAEFLTSRAWLFMHAEGDVIAPEVHLESSGRIAGVGHPNETRWRLEDGTLLFLHENGEPSTRFTEATVEDGHMIFVGRLLLAPPGETVVHALREK